MPDHPPLRVIQLTPLGRGAIASLRVEGSTAVTITELFFRAHSGRPLSACPIDRLVVGRFSDEHSRNSGEEVVVRHCADGAMEVHCHGGHAAVAQIEKLLISAGCERVAWQSWVADSHNDPIATKALTALAEARTERTAAILMDQYHGALCRALNEIEKAMERGNMAFARRQIEELLARATLGRHLVQPWRVVLGGRVNVGKSSLINALVGYGRSIVHHSPGTTRDAVTAVTAVDGWPIELCDTAGLHAGNDAVELAGMQLARQHLAQADLAILVFDFSAPWSNEDEALLHQCPHALVVFNKCDLSPAPGARPAGLVVSALHGHGLTELLAAVSDRLVPNPPPPGAAVPLDDAQVDMIRRLSVTTGV